MNTTITARVSGSATATLAFYVTDCCTCGTIFAIPQTFKERRYADGKTFYCPNGHSMSWNEDEADRQRRRADRAESQRDAARISRDAARDQAQAAERTARALRGHLTRMRRSVAAGRCPVAGCRRTFSNVVAHIEGQHATWVHEHPGVLS